MAILKAPLLGKPWKASSQAADSPEVSVIHDFLP